MTPKPGEVYVRDGERRTVRSASAWMVNYYFDDTQAYGVSYDFRKDWDQWAAGAQRVEKETNNE